MAATHFVCSEAKIQSYTRESQSGNCVVLPGAGLMRTGKKVQCQANQEGGILVGEIISVADRRDARKAELKACGLTGHSLRERLVLVRQFPFSASEKKRPCPSQFNLLPESLPEVERSCYLQWTKANVTLGIAFVFHADSTQQGKHLCGGISNSYYIRDSLDETHQIKAMSVSDFEPFIAASGIKSYSKRVCNGMTAMTELTHRAMSSRGQWDGRNKHTHLIGGNYELYCYMKQGIESEFGDSIIKAKFQSARAKKRINADLSVSNKRIKTSGQMVRVLEEQALETLRNTMGASFAVANTRAVPTMKAIKESEGRVSDTVHLCDQDVVRIVTCLEDDHDLDPKKEQAPCPISSLSLEESVSPIDKAKAFRRQPRLLPYPGLDFEYLESETGMTDIHVNLRFKKLLGSSATVRRAQSVCVAAAVDAETGTGLSEGDELLHEGVPHEVSKVLGNGTVQCIKCGCESDGTDLELTKEEATELVDKFSMQQ